MGGTLNELPGKFSKLFDCTIYTFNTQTRFLYTATNISLCILQETFDAGLQAFEKEGIQTITTLKDQLVNARHAQTPAIERRYNDVIARWQKLLADSEGRRQKLLLLQEQYRQIEDLYLTFAKKASAFNSWFENAEEDLTDPVRCNSVEEIKVGVYFLCFIISAPYLNATCLE